MNSLRRILLLIFLSGFGLIAHGQTDSLSKDSMKVLQKVVVRKRSKKIKFPKINLSKKRSQFLSAINNTDNVAVLIDSKYFDKDLYGFKLRFSYEILFSKVDIPITTNIYFMHKDSSIELIHSQKDTAWNNQKMALLEQSFYLAKTRIDRGLGVLIAVKNSSTEKKDNLSLRFSSKYKSKHTYTVVDEKRAEVKNLWPLFAEIHQLKGNKFLNWSIKVEVVQL